MRLKVVVETIVCVEIQRRRHVVVQKALPLLRCRKVQRARNGEILEIKLGKAGQRRGKLDLVQATRQREGVEGDPVRLFGRGALYHLRGDKSALLDDELHRGHRPARGERGAILLGQMQSGEELCRIEARLPRIHDGSKSLE